MSKGSEKENGMVLVTVIILGAIVIMIGTAMLSTGVMEVKSGNYFENKTQAYYVAKAGADIVAKKIIDKNIVIPSYPASFTGNIDGDSYKVDVSKISNEISIKSTGQSKGVKDEVVLKVLQKVSTSTVYNFDMAIFSNNNINLENGVTITGDVGTNNSIGDGSGDNGKIIGNAYVGPTGNVKSGITVSGGITKLAGTRTYLSPVMPTVPEGLAYPANHEEYYETYTYVGSIRDGFMEVVNKNYQFDMISDISLKQIKVSSNSKLTINVGSQNRVMVVDKFDVTQGQIFILGTGSLTIYAKEKFYVKGSINWDEPNKSPNKLKVYYYGVNSVSIDNETKFCGVFQSGLAPLNLSGGGNFNGTIISGTTGAINVDGGHQAYTNVLYAPNATVNISGGGNFKGSIVGKSISVTGGGSVTFNSTGSVSVPVTSGGSVTYEKRNYQ